MSSTGRSACRHPDDFYETPAWVTRAILRTLPRPAAGSAVLDPCCGRGAILDVVRELWPDVLTFGIELDGYRANIASSKGHDVVQCDSLKRDLYPARWGISLIVQNPPFSMGMEFVQRAIQEAPSVVSLHRQGFGASMRRAAFWRAHTADMHVLARRPSFAVSLRCGAPKTAKRPAVVGCGWAGTFPHDDLPNCCPECMSTALTKCTSDSCDYAWFRFGDGATGKWSVLEVEDA